MASFWHELRERFAALTRRNGPKRLEVDYYKPTPAAPTAFRQSVNDHLNAQGFPNTFPRTSAEKPEAVQPQYFEPALKHFPRAFRVGDPTFASPDDATRWYTARAAVMAHLLQLVANSPLREALVLRGSLLLKTWLGDAAREPGDMDWVVTPQSTEVTSPVAKEILCGLIALATEQPAVGEASIDTKAIAMDDIWTYDRAPGKRIVFPWSICGLPPGSIQMDLVFSEPLLTDPVLTAIPVADGDPVTIWGVERELALAWKLLWLETDCYPQGKDLYDAVLLAEQTSLPFSLLEQVVEKSEWYEGDGLAPDFPLQWDVDWETFKREYPWVQGEGREWLKRLATALAPTFANQEQAEE